MITQSADGRGRRAPYGGRGRGRSDAAGRGRGQRQHVSNGEGRGSFGQQWLEPSLGHPGQPVFNDGHPPGFASEPGKATQGAIVALLDSYGFIRPQGGQAQIFFHGSEVQSPNTPTDEQFDLQELLQLGDEVSFEIKHVSNKDKKINAINVSKLPKGTIAALQSAERGRYKGTVKTLPGESSWRSQDVTPGKILFSKPATTGEAVEQMATFKPADLQEKALKLHIGDKVEFSLVQQPDNSTPEDVATEVVLVSRAASGAGDGGQLQGCVISVKEGFGFIRPAARANDRIYFRLGDIVGGQGAAGGQGQQVALNDEVSFVMVPDPRGNQDRAANVQILNTGFAADQLSMLSGVRQGRVITPPVAHANEQTQDGVLVYNEGPASFHCSFGSFQVSGEAALEEDDEVSFEAGSNPATGARKATTVQLLTKANGQSIKKDLGQIITMRTQFGFIKCCERPGEMFFHFSALTGGPEVFAVGDDVEFSITREPKGERLNAVGITKAPQGSAVFETVSEEQFSGRVVERMMPPRGYNAVSTSGLLAYELDGNKHQIPFGFGDLQDSSLNPGTGDKVTFHVATHLATAKAAEKVGGANSKYAGRRAVHVAGVSQEGMAVDVAGPSGVVEFTEDQPYDVDSREDKQRIPFQLSEVQDGVELKASDLVQFVLQTDTRSKERQAARIKRLKEGDGVVPEEAQRRNPNAIKFTGGPAEGVGKARANQAVRIARGPDGTRGFTAALQPGGRARLLPPPAPNPPETAAAPGSAGPDQAVQRASSGNMNQLPASDARTPSPSPLLSQQANGRGKGRGQAGRAGRGRGQGTATSPAPSPPVSIPQILRLPPRQQSSSPVPRGASPTPATANISRKQESPSASQALHRQTVVALATRQQAGKGGNLESNPGAAQPSILQKPQGNVLAAANGQTVASGADSKVDSTDRADSSDKMGSGLQRTDSGKMLNPFASTFIPRTASGSMLSTSASSSQ